MSTFAELAAEARLIATSQSPGAIDYARMIARLAEAMDRFEYNTARALHLMRRAVNDVGTVLPYSTEDWLAHLRQELSK